VRTWSQLDLESLVVDVLTDVPCVNDVHHFGRPYVSAYQLAIELERRHPEVVAQIGKPIGGAGTGQHDSLSQYVANQLSREIRARGDAYPVQGAFLSNQNAREISFVRSNGEPVISSLVGTQYDLSLFRLRQPA
jgi:hypothetical protein